MAAVRAWGLYPPEHPASGAAVARLSAALPASPAAALAFTVTPQILAVAGVALPDEQPVVDAARLLHARDIQQIAFLDAAPVTALHQLLTLLGRPAEEVRTGGGPAAWWAASGHPSIVIEAIDYAEILRDRETTAQDGPRDDVWQSIVSTMVAGDGLFDEAQQQRLLHIAGTSDHIGLLAGDVAAPKCAADGSPLITTQAATVLAVFRHLTSLVQVVEPDRVPAVIRNVAAAASSLNPHVVLQMMQIDDADHAEPLVARLAAAFDDQQVAQLLASALSRDGRATARLAQIFGTIAPDVERRQRVLTMTRSFLTDTDFGRSGQFGVAWASMEALLLDYDERPYVSEAYQATLAGADARAREMADRGLPEELPGWMESIDQDHVRRLSVQMLTDLLSIEDSGDRAIEIARDLAALGEDVLMCGAFDDACQVATVLATSAATPGAVTQAACRAAMTDLAQSVALASAASVLGDLDAPAAEAFSRCCQLLGPRAIGALTAPLATEPDSQGWTRAAAIIHGFGDAAITPLATLADAPHWRTQWSAATLLGRTHHPQAVTALQALMRRGDTRVMRAAIGALSGIDDAAAGQALQHALEQATDENRAGILDAVVSAGDTRAVPLLCRMLEGADPFGDAHGVVLGLMRALGRLKDDRAVSALVATLLRRKRFARTRQRAVKTGAIRALQALASPEADAKLAEAARADRLVRKLLESRA